MANAELKTFVSLYCDYGNIQTLTATLEYTADKINDGSDVHKLKKNGLPTRPYTPTKGDKIYFLQGCTVPRFKVKQFCETYGVSLVKNPEKANIKFAGPDSFNDLIHSIPGYLFRKDDVMKYIRPLVMMTDQIEAVFKMIEESTIDIVGVPYAIYQELKKRGKGDVYPDMLQFKDYKSAVDYMILTSSPDIYSQNEILKKINTGGVLGKEQYESIQRMFKSTDIENTKLAMEAMANSDYEQSCVYLLLLLKTYGSKMYESPTKAHVNFKSLLKFFDISVKDLSYGIDLNYVVNALISKKLLNKTNLDLLTPQVVEQMTQSSGNRFFEVVKVRPTEEVYGSLSNNVLDGKCNTEVMEEEEDDFSPKGIPVL